MKKWLVILIFLSVFLTGCQKKEISMLSFTKASSVFSQNLIDLNHKTKQLGNSESKATQLILKTKGENRDFKIDSSILLSGKINYNLFDFDLSYDIFLYFWDKKEQKETKLSSILEHKKTGQHNYIKFTDPFIDIGAANYQGNLISMISQSLGNKWILVDSDLGSWWVQSLQDIRFVIETISNINIFVPTGQHTYESNLAYKVEIKPESLDYINSKISAKIEQFKGLLIVNSENDLELKIDDLLWKSKENRDIEGFISSNQIKLKIKKDNQKEYLYEISIAFTKKQTNFYLSKKLHLQELFNLNININNKQYTDKIKNQIIGSLKVSPLVIYGTDLEKDIKIDINGEQIIYPQDVFSIQKPESYVIGQQILGDDFSLKTIMSEANNVLETQQ